MADGRRIVGFYVLFSVLLTVTRHVVSGGQGKDVYSVKDDEKVSIESDSTSGNSPIVNGLKSVLTDLDPTVNVRWAPSETAEKKIRSAEVKPEARFWNSEWMRSASTRSDFDKIPGRFEIEFGFRMNTSAGMARIAYKKDFA